MIFFFLQLAAYNNAKLRPYYEARRQKFAAIPGFWANVFRGASHLLDPYVTLEDFNLLLLITDLYVEWDEKVPTDFTIEFTFDKELATEYLKEDSLVLRKKFTYKEVKPKPSSSKDDDDEDEEGEEKKEGEDKDDEEEEEEEDAQTKQIRELQKLILERESQSSASKHISTPVEIHWQKNKNLTTVSATGVNSFFSWFKYMGHGPGDFVGGDELATIFAEEIFPEAIQFYYNGLFDQAEGEDEFDLSDEEEDIGDDDEDDLKSGSKNKKKKEQEEEKEEKEEEEESEEDTSEQPPKKKAKKN